MTEMIYSVDLIEEQIRVAMGEKLRYKQVILALFVKFQIEERDCQKSSSIWNNFLYRRKLCLEDTRLNAVSMQKTHLKGLDLALVRSTIYMLHIPTLSN